MKVNLLGYCDVDFTNKEGERICGTNVYVAMEDPTGNTLGLKAEKIFIQNERIITINLHDFLGKQIDVEYGPKNKCYGISA